MSQHTDTSRPHDQDCATRAAIDDEALRWFMALREHGEGDPRRAQAEAGLRAWLARDPAHARAYEACVRDWSRLAPLESVYRQGDAAAAAARGTPSPGSHDLGHPQAAGHSQAAARSHVPARAQVRAKASAHGHTHAHARRRLPLRLAATALGAVLLAAGAGVWHGYGYADFSLAGPRRFATTLDEQGSIAMRDGSRVAMDVGTELRVDYSGGLRRVRLLAGAAYFDVAADPQRPFLVQAGAGTARVLGTAFEVERLDGAMRVAVERGRVRVEAADGAAVALAPAQSVEASGGGLGPVHALAPSQVAAWRHGRLLFDGQPLSEVARALSRRGAWTVQADPAVAALPVTLTVRLDDVANALAALPDVLPVQVNRSGRIIRIAARSAPPAAEAPQRRGR